MSKTASKLGVGPCNNDGREGKGILNTLNGNTPTRYIMKRMLSYHVHAGIREDNGPRRHQSRFGPTLP